jgi:hypothetical protein
MLPLLLAASVLAAPAAPAVEADAKPVTAAYYYKVRWGFQQEFQDLFFKNHYPLLKAQTGGRIKHVEVLKPTYHGDGRADWTFLVIITSASWAAFESVPGTDEDLARKLFPDQERYKKEEQRRFEILDAHWDVPLSSVDPPQ